jgi:tetratricopeptide (TPR) repeat protein
VALMAIKGSLKEASLPDVIQLLALGRKTGCLAVADRQNFGYTYFDDGRIIYASIVNRRDRIGDLLVRNGRITDEQLRAAVDRQTGDRDRKIGEILVELGHITRAELEDHIRVQVEEAVYYLFTWSSGTFNFEAGVRPEREDFLVSINPESLLLEGARRVDEWSLIAKKIPTLDIVFEVDQERLQAAGVRLSDEQEAILTLLNGRNDVQDVMDASGLVEFEVGKAIYGLLSAGFVRRVGTSATQQSERVNDARVEEHRNLGIAFYKTGMLEEAEREFRRVAELRPTEGNAPFYLGLLALRQARWEDAVEAFRSAIDLGGARAAALHNLALALERAERLAEAEAAGAEAVARAPQDPRPMLLWGVIALKREDPEVAEGRLTKARELLGSKAVPAVWFWAAALAAGSAGDMPRAVAVAKEGTKAWPQHPVLRNNLAVLLEATGDLAAAETLLRAALADEPSLPQLSKNLGDLLYRAGRYDDAQAAFDRAAKLAPDLGDDLYFKLGNLAFRQRDRDRARDCWRRAAELNPGHQLARSNLEILDVPA